MNTNIVHLHIFFNKKILPLSMEEAKNYTSKDIAAMAGVSRGTVDRVLHNRGKVSAKSEAKVRAVLQKIDYQPNILAQSLRVSKKLTIVVLLPSAEVDEYWAPCHQGIEEVIQQYAGFGIRFMIENYSQDAPNSYRSVAKDVLLRHQPDGLVTAAMFAEEATAVFELYHKKGIPVITFNTLIEGAPIDAFIGQNLQQSGRIAAELLLKLNPHRKSGHIYILHIGESLANSPHMQAKENGFVSYCETHTHFHCKSLNLVNNIQQSLESVLADPENVGVFVSTSRVYEIANLKQPQQQIPIIGYDLLKENIAALQQDRIAFIIFQNPRKQAKLAAQYLGDKLLFNKAIPHERLLPVEVITKESLM